MRGRAEDLTGRRFGRLTVIEKTTQKQRSVYLWRCKCDCGNETLQAGYNLTSGAVQSCGCLQDASRRTDINGQRRGHLTAIRQTDKRYKNSTIWVWRCDCGAEVEYPARLIKSSNSRTMCPTCAEKFKAEQAAQIRNRIERFETGCPVKTADAIRNGIPTKQNSSGVRGVTYDHHLKKWRARIDVKGKTITLGNYDTLEKAAAARNAAVAEIYGSSTSDTNE